MLGYTIARDRLEKRTIIAVFGNYGFNNNHTINQIFQDQDYVTNTSEQSTVNNYFLLEGGLLIGEIFRISTGVGQQNFDNQVLVDKNGISDTKKLFKYNSTTVGFRYSFGKVTWVIDCNFASGDDFDNTLILPSTGLMFLF